MIAYRPSSIVHHQLDLQRISAQKDIVVAALRLAKPPNGNVEAAQTEICVKINIYSSSVKFSLHALENDISN